MAPTIPEEAPKKRGRGRPPKAEGPKKAVYVPTGRPRGRPKGSGVVKKPATGKPATGTGRGRGRPKKSDIADATTTPTAETATPKKSTPAKSATSTGRPRGRPRKSDASIAAPTPKKAESAQKAKERKSDVSIKESFCSDSSSGSDNEEQARKNVSKPPSDAADSAEEVRRWFPSKMIRGLIG
ncbi:hypothetical protein CTA2_9079 [Colletotrichum tanaceti]|uniref:AT hook domain-containing protein n=1 Tax=Colletotrichum tanaceti TaxID=1306861 RepID=A0A4U6XTP3_9PEZI|nr:hypothetical protein CTA2_9079 [Colletotrichum tanaceti]TKW59241.1 hypothetical protein CTA1_1937 [Colletotrichum tanaceti]